MKKISVKETVADNQLIVKLSEYEKPDIFTLKEPYRIVLDFNKVKFDGHDGKIEVNSGYITQVRWADHDGYYTIFGAYRGHLNHLEQLAAELGIDLACVTKDA
jgi:hypothetical protein